MDIDLTLSQWIIALLTLLVGGFSKGVTGIGLPSILTPSLAAIFGIQVAVPMVAISTVTMNLLLMGRYNQAWREVTRIWPMIAVGLVTTFVGVLVLQRGNQTAMSMLLSLMAMIYVLLEVTGKRLVIPPNKINIYGVPAGLLAGFFQGTIGVCGPVAIAYIAGIKEFSRQAYFFAISIAFLLFSINQFVGYVAYGMYTARIALMGAVAVVPVMCSFYLGIRLQEKLDIKKIRTATLVIIFAGALKLFVSTL